MKILDATHIFPLRLCCAQDTTREALKHVYLDPATGTAVATDGCKLAYVEQQQIKTLTQPFLLKFPKSFKLARGMTLRLVLPDVGEPLIPALYGRIAADCKVEDLPKFGSPEVCPLESLSGPEMPQYPDFRQVLPTGANSFRLLGLDAGIFKTLSDTINHENKDRSWLAMAENLTNVSGIAVGHPSSPIRGLLMPMRITEPPTAENPYVPIPTAQYGEKADDLLCNSLRNRIKELEQEIAALKLVKQTP